MLDDLLEAAIRVPDHGKLVPFRLITLRGEHKLRFGERLAALAIARHPDMSEAKREKERLRYTFAPLVIVVVCRIDTGSSVPPIEQQLSAGCVAYNLLLGAERAGFRRAMADRLGRLRPRRRLTARPGRARACDRLRAYRHRADRTSPTAIARRWPSCLSEWSEPH